MLTEHLDRIRITRSPFFKKLAQIEWWQKDGTDHVDHVPELEVSDFLEQELFCWDDPAEIPDEVLITLPREVPRADLNHSTVGRVHHAHAHTQTIYCDCNRTEGTIMSTIPYQIVPANEIFGETGPRLLIEEKYMTDEHQEGLVALMEETGVDTIRMIPDLSSLSEGETLTADGYVASPGLMDLIDGKESTSGSQHPMSSADGRPVGFEHPVTVTGNDVHIDLKDSLNLETLLRVPENIEWVRERLEDPAEPPYWRIHAGDDVVLGVHEGMYAGFSPMAPTGDVLRDHIEAMLIWMRHGEIPDLRGTSTPGSPAMPPMKRTPKKGKKRRRK